MVNARSSQPKPRLFAIPAAAVARHPDVLLKPRQLKPLLDTLPLANPPKAARMLLRQLKLLSRDPQPGNKFGSMLTMYEAPIETLFHAATARIQVDSDSALALDQLEHEVLDTLTELAYANLRLANDRLVAGKKPALETLYRAIRLLEQALSIEQLHYHKPIAGNWRLLLNVYLHAAQHDIAKQPLDRKLCLEDDPNTIHGLFYRALLICLCDPHHHRPSQVATWRDWTGRNADGLDLALLPQGGASIPVDISGLTTPLAAARCGKPGPDIRYLTADDFVQSLRNDPEAPAGLLDALNGLIKGRRTPEQRQNGRQLRDHPYRLLYGLRLIHQRLNNLMQGTNDDLAVYAVPGKQINQSKQGSAFRVQGPLNPPLTIGELVLAEASNDSTNSPPVGFVARIQRVMIDNEKRIEIGVEKLCGRIMPVEITGRAVERTRGDTLALLQHTMDSGRFTLIATRSIYREGDLVAIEGPGVRYNLRLRGLLGTTQRIAFIDAEPSDG